VSAPLYLALLHHPVRNRDGQIVTSSVTNMDIHDIARSARTFGVTRPLVTHPIPGLRALCERVVWHWQEGYGARHNPSRREAMGLVRVEPDLDHVIAQVEQEAGRMPRLVATSARPRGRPTVSFRDLREALDSGDEAILLLLGTGHGLAEEILDRCDQLLEPLQGLDQYNHLSVRSAAAILLDRLRSRDRS